MKFCFQIPTPNIDYFAPFSNTHLLLTHLIQQNSNYKNYFKTNHNSYYTILDNSAFELGKSVAFKQLLDTANELKVNEVVCPDVLTDTNKTIDLTREFLSILPRKTPYKLMGVVQGRTFGELKYCYSSMYYNDKIDIIGIPKNSMSIGMKSVTGTTNVSINRTTFIEWIYDKHKIDFIKPMHLLGMGTVYELSRFKDLKKVRSIDSTIPVLLGSLGIKISDKYEKPHPMDFFKSIPAKNFKTVIHNIKKVQGLAGDDFCNKSHIKTKSSFHSGGTNT